ncbi:hypothetical protein [Actinoallomurus acaciae]|uniref:DUF2637 domain-containing protein n=1 Tax=Actinoallomurus acaciae TaxID=502577 RepID=A0ABV5YPD7_9ACTN
MRQSLSKNSGGGRSAGRAVVVAIALSLVLAVAAIIDQTGGHSLTDHTDAVYRSSGKQPSAALLYGLVYTVAVIDAVLWLLVLGVARSHRLPASALAVTVIVITAGLALLLLASSEYDARIFPPLWGTLAILPAVAGILATVFLLRRAPEQR